ncbi:14388_t:CDS:2 [Acaulospora morrowiae]|uniref:14388_t:CDS:1 n=1 Tax=Acaulospora morrowiae TaxID=94023 RepID=A0A9N9DLH5_9GLOM|nr:14388_t:CDS:2 [Acaulospora morrowiae]
MDHKEAQKGTYKEMMSATLGDAINFRRGISTLVALSSIRATASIVWSGSRIIASAANSNLIPYFSPLLRKFLNGPRIIKKILRKFRVIEVDPDENNPNEDSCHDAPIGALIFQWLYCSIIIFVFPKSHPYEILVTMTQYSALIFFGLSALGLKKKRRTL